MENKFQQADPWGRPVNLPDGSPKPEELIPEDPDNPSYLLLAYEINNNDKPNGRSTRWARAICWSSTGT